MKEKNNKQIGLLDLLAFFVKRKWFFLFTMIPITILIYLSIFFFVDEQFDSSATILPSEDSDLSGIASVLSNVDGLPFGLSAGSSPEIGRYNTIIYSRVVLEDVIAKFDLLSDYGLDTTVVDYRKKAVETVRDNIETEVTEEGAYNITVRAHTPQKAADIANYLILRLNDKMIELKVRKSRNNRMFLGERLLEVKNNLRVAEDSLMFYQRKTGILSPEEQLSGIMSAYTKLETDLIAKEVQYAILEEIYDEGAPELLQAKIELDEYEKKLRNIKNEGQGDGLLPPISSLPAKAINYFRYLREVEINSKILEFVLPLYEQARLEEQKQIPVLQVLDSAVPPAKKSYPPRTLATLLIAFVIFIFLYIITFIKENSYLSQDPQYRYIVRNMFRWKNT